MKAQLPVYLQRARHFSVDHASVEDFSTAVLQWWHDESDEKISAWSEAARIAFAISPNSASCERVFSLVKILFGELQLNSLADVIQSALMLNYHGRSIG